MISSEASASELAISSAITPTPSLHASAGGMKSSAAPPLRASAPAKGPPTLPWGVCAAIRPQARHRPQFFLYPVGQIRADPYFSTRVYHILLLLANVNPSARALHCRTVTLQSDFLDQISTRAQR